MISRLSIRAKITLGSILVAAALLAVALLVVRGQVAATVTDADSTLARSDLLSFEKDIAADPSEGVDDPGTGVLVYVRSPDGRVQVDTLPHDILELVANRSASNEQYTTTDDEGRTFVVVGRSVSTIDGDWALWSARSTSSSQLALEGLDRVLLGGGLVLLIGFGAASWLLATAALRPVTAMRRRAEQLGEGDPDGQLPVGAARDELAALATTLNGFLARVQASRTREKQMVSDAAHELRTPLAVLKTQLELAQGDAGNAQALAAHVRAAGASVDRLASLAANLLELSRLESQEAPPRSTTAGHLVNEFTGSIDRARVIAVRSDVTVDFAVEVAHDDDLYAIDAQAFGRLSDNLLSNAIAALHAGGTVAASLRQSGRELILTVIDNGPGMPEEFLPVAFERFTRPDASRTASTGGSGLGLAVVRALAVDADGSATLANLSPGLRVTVTLPKM